MLLLVQLLVIIYMHAWQEKDPVVSMPSHVYAVMTDSKLFSQVKVNKTQNPFYLRGDFDGDGLPDYAVAICGLKTGNPGILIITSRSKIFVLGADNPKEYLGLPSSKWFTSDWEVFTRKDASKLFDEKEEGRYTPTIPIRPKGEVIGILHNEQFCTIYWNGKDFQMGWGRFD